MAFMSIMNRLCLDRIREKRQEIPVKDINDYIVEKKLIGYECLICLEEFNEEEIVSLIICGHIYHTHCLYTWFLKKRTCPLCDEELIID
jgi:hypothetical protein